MADGTETVKKIQKTATEAQNAGAQFAREAMEKSMAGLTDLNAQGKKNLDAVVESATAAQKGAEALSQQAFAYGKSSWEAGVAAAQSLSQARSVQELVELQSAYAKTSIEAYLAEVTKAAETVSGSVKDSFKPINERVTATVQTLQAAR